MSEPEPSTSTTADNNNGGKEEETTKEPCCVFFNKHVKRKSQLRKRMAVGPTLRTPTSSKPEEEEKATTEKADNSSDEGEDNETDILGILPMKRNKRTPLSEIQSVNKYHCAHNVNNSSLFSTDTQAKGNIRGAGAWDHIRRVRLSCIPIFFTFIFRLKPFHF